MGAAESIVADAPRESEPEKPRSKRVVSLDAARAIAVVLMIFMDHPSIESALPNAIIHPEWHGFRLPDAVFPAFIFIAGMSLAYSVSRRKDLDFKKATLVFLRRIGTLFLIGVALNLVKYGLPVRYLGVLQRIALVLLIVWPFARLRIRWVLTGAAVLLAVHGALLLFVDAPGIVAGDFTARAATLSGYIDRMVLGVAHTYQQSGFDPEGVLGTLSAAAQALFGLAMGKWLIRHPKDERGLARLAGIGVLVAASGWVLASAIDLPLNKPMWTPTLVLASTGIFVVLFAWMYWIADIKGHTRLFSWLVPVGKNALLVYVASNVLVALAKYAGLFPKVGYSLAQYLGETWASLAITMAELALWFVVAAWLDRKKIYWKL